MRSNLIDKMNEIYDSDNTRPNMYRLAVYLGQLFSKKIIIDQGEMFMFGNGMKVTNTFFPFLF